MVQQVHRLPKVKATVGKSKSAIYQEMAAGTFPRPIRLGPRAVGWLERDLEQWIEDRSNLSRVASSTKDQDDRARRSEKDSPSLDRVCPIGRCTQ